jgi:DNA-binding MarR family transcriptional regulator
VSDGLVPGVHFPSRAHELWALLIQSFQGWEDRVNSASAAAGLSPVSAWALVQLDPDHPISQKELAARLRCTPSTVVDPTDHLEDAGLVVRKANQADRRVNVLVVTPKGKRVRDDLIGRLFEPPAAFRGLPSRDLSRFRDLMLAATAEPRPATASRPHGKTVALSGKKRAR